MLKKSLYLYAMMIFSLTALQATEELPTELTEQTMVKGGCRRCPCESSSSSSSIRSVYAVAEDDNKELNVTENLFSFSNDKENDPSDISGCRGRKKPKSSSSSSDRKALACPRCKGEEEQVLFACEVEKEGEMRILPISA